MSKRENWLDMAKGIGILSVVAYHSVEEAMNNFGPLENMVMLSDFFKLWIMPAY